MPKRYRLAMTELAPEIKQRLRGLTKPRERERLLAVQMALSGQWTLQQIADAVGRARSRIGAWMRLVQDEGLPALLGIHQGRGRQPALKPKALKELRRGLRRGRWTRAKDAQQWLAERHQVRMGLGGVRYWLKKHQGVLRVPRRRHTRKDDAHGGHFQATLARQLWALGIPKARPVRVWFMDEHRYGLISHARRCWTLRGVRPRARYRTRYEWG